MCGVGACGALFFTRQVRKLNKEHAAEAESIDSELERRAGLGRRRASIERDTKASVLGRSTKVNTKGKGGGPASVPKTKAGFGSSVGGQPDVEITNM